MTNATNAELLAQLQKQRGIQDTLRRALHNERAEREKACAEINEKLRASEAGEQRLRGMLRLLGVSDAIWGAAGAAGSPPYSLPPGVGRDISPENSPPGSRQPSPQYSPPLRPRSPQYPPPGSQRAQAAADPPSLEELDAEKLEALESNVRAALARVKLAQERLEALEAVGATNPDFCCSITGTTMPMRRPVILEDGTSYEEEAILNWFECQKRDGGPFTSPLTRNEVPRKLVPNLTLRNLIAAAVQAELNQRGEKREREREKRERKERKREKRKRKCED